MTVMRTRLALVYLGIAALAIGAMVAVRADASAWAIGLLVALILFAGICMNLVCGSLHRRLDALKAQVQAGGTVTADGECAELGQAIGNAVASQKASLTACRLQLADVRDSEARTRLAAQALIDALPHAVALLSPAGSVDLANPRAAWFGLEKDQSVDHAPHPWLKALFARALETRQRVGLPDCQDQKETPSQGKCCAGLVQMFDEGRELFYLPQADPLIDAQGQLTGVVLTLVDMTAARQAEEARTNLLASLAHEVRTPMTSLQMSIYLLLDDAASRLTPRQLELLQAARDDADRLHRIVEGVLTRPKP